AAADDRARPAQHGDVVAEHHDGTTVDRAVAADLAVAGCAIAVLDPHRAAERTELAERTGVEDAVDVLTDRLVPLGPQPGQLVGATHLGAYPAGPFVQVAHHVGRGENVVVGHGADPTGPADQRIEKLGAMSM